MFTEKPLDCLPPLPTHILWPVRGATEEATLYNPVNEVETMAVTITMLQSKLCLNRELPRSQPSSLTKNSFCKTSAKYLRELSEWTVGEWDPLALNLNLLHWFEDDCA